MIHKFRKGVARCLFHAPLLAAALSVPANAIPPTFKAGEVVVYAFANTPQADINALAAKVNAQAVKSLLLPDCYDFVLPAAAQDDNSTLNAVTVLKGDPRVRWVGTNRYKSGFQATTPASVTPNDPLFATAQWDMQLINMPAAWGVQKGVANVNVCVINSGFNSTHPDLQGVFLPASYNFGDNNSNILPDGTDDDNQHGTHCSGVIGANTNNSIGIAGIMWTGPGAPKSTFPQILGLKIHALTDPPDENNGTSYLNALAYLQSHVIDNNIKVLSMSIGAPTGEPPDPTDPEYVALNSIYNQGVVIVAAAGNDSADAHTYAPAGFPFVISVSAIGTKKEFSFYSNFGKVELAAPGGDDPTGTNAALQVTSTLAGAYGVEQGTSMACPHVAGVAELLMSMPGMTRDNAIKLLESSADTSMNKVPGTKDVQYGWGILQADRALLMASEQASIQVGVDANGNPPAGSVVNLPIKSYQPRIPIQTIGLPLNRIQITIQTASGGQLESLTADQLNQPKYADLLPNPNDPNSAVQVVSATIPQYNIVLQPKKINSVNGSVYTVTVADPDPPAALINTSNSTATLDQRTISIQQHIINQYNVDNGPSMVSVPYFGGKNGNAIPSPVDLFGPNVIINRYNASTGMYVQYSGASLANAFTSDESGASASGLAVPVAEPGIALTTPTGTTKALDIRPVGLGFFIENGVNSGTGTLTPSPSQIPVPPISQDGGNDSIGLHVPTTAAYIPVPDPAVPTQTDTVTAPQSAIDIPLYEGWNMVGDPYPYAVTFNTTLVRTLTGSILPVGVAADQGLMAPFIYRRITGSYQFQVLPAGELAPWEGHWIYIAPKNAASPSSRPVLTLVVPPQPTSTTSAGTGKATSVSRSAAPIHWVPTSADGTPQVSGPNSWQLQIAAATKSMVDAHNYVGMSQGATNGIDDTKVPKPPTPSPYVTVGMTRQETPGTLYAQDLRPVGGTQQWQLTVKTDQPKSDVAVTWPNASGIPKAYRVTLTDAATGTIVDLKTNNSYHFTSGTSGGTRSFILTARMAPMAGAITLSNIVVNQVRSADGRAQSAFEVDYVASQAANVDVSILSSAGRRIATVNTSAGASAGSSRAIWNGRDAAGRAMPAGAYVVEIRAVASDGSMTRQTRPLIISGR